MLKSQSHVREQPCHTCSLDFNVWRRHREKYEWAVLLKVENAI